MRTQPYLTQALADAGISLRTAAERLGLSHGVLKQRSRGRTEVTIGEALKARHTIGDTASVADLLGAAVLVVLAEGGATEPGDQAAALAAAADLLTRSGSCPTGC